MESNENLSVKLFPIYQKTINLIDDFFEYRYKNDSIEGIKNHVMGILDKLSEESEFVCKKNS